MVKKSNKNKDIKKVSVKFTMTLDQRKRFKIWAENNGRDMTKHLIFITNEAVPPKPQ